MSHVTERIEIFPGHWIEVTKKIKEKAGLKPSARVVATLLGHTTRAAEAVGSKGGNRKYDLLMLDEAVRIAKQAGLREAVRVTGIKSHSIQFRQKQLRVKSGRHDPWAMGHRYTMAQKQACVRLAQELMGSGETSNRKFPSVKGGTVLKKVPKWPHRKAFVEAGRRLGMNGRSVELMWIQGMIPLTQHPSGE